MNRKEVIEFDESLKKDLSKIAVDYETDSMLGSYIIDNHITVILKDARKGMIFFGEESVSYKLGNTKIEFKRALAAGLELLTALNKPKSTFNYIQLLIASMFFIEKSIKVKIGKVEAYIV